MAVPYATPMGGTVAPSPGPLDKFPRIIYIDLRGARNSQKLHDQGEPNIMPKRTWTIEGSRAAFMSINWYFGPATWAGRRRAMGRQGTPAGRIQPGVDSHRGQQRPTAVCGLPTRGMGIWRASLGNVQLGCEVAGEGAGAPVAGPLADPGGVGWIERVRRAGRPLRPGKQRGPEFNPNGRSATACTAGSPTCRPIRWKSASTATRDKST